MQNNIPTKVEFEDEMAKVNKEMYERNVELAIRNQTLSTLRKMYEIINSSFGVEETAQKLIEAIVGELKFAKAFIAVTDKKEKILKSIALSPSSEKEQAVLDSFGRPIYNFSVPLDNDDNYCIKCINQKHPRMTNDLFDILTPLTDEKSAEKIAQGLNIKTSVIFPLTFAQEILGVLVICMDKHIGDLSHVELDTIRELIEVVSIAIERTQIYHQLQEANESLKQMDKLKDEFITFTSHELRTPMTAIKSYAWMLLNGKTGELNLKSLEYLNRVYLSSDRLIKMVNDMLNVSRIESGRIDLTIAPFNIDQLVTELLEEFHAKALERKIKLVADIPDKNLLTLADRGKIQEVLENLIGNALKFTPEEGSITITVETVDTFAKFSIKDTGKGISPTDISKLFTKFGRLDNSYEYLSASSGSGLGLFISKRFVELCKGKIWIESEIGKGTSFIFTLPKAS